MGRAHGGRLIATAGTPRPSLGRRGSSAIRELREPGAEEFDLEVRTHMDPDADQTIADLDQTQSDADQTVSDADRVLSASDQLNADSDQRAFDRDQVAADRDRHARPRSNAGSRRAYDASRAERINSTRDRDATSSLRALNAAERLESAVQRDETAALRDLTARARDRAADARDRAAEAQDRQAGSLVEKEARALAALRAVRVSAAQLRAQAADDRARAVADREKAAEDRRQAAEDLRHAHVDQLTGAYGRGMGQVALQHEVDRARRSGRPLVLAFVDVDGLKVVNDRLGHAAGDALLQDVVAAIRLNLRSYDVVTVRMGGDEFICALPEIDLAVSRRRFDDIRAALASRVGGGSISVGLAELGPDDDLQGLTVRGDLALYESKTNGRGDD
jgi:diguanylate cyclase (GGDEF)-like protein